jgi:hypothetical protein
MAVRICSLPVNCLSAMRTRERQAPAYVSERPSTDFTKFDVSLSSGRPETGGKGPKVYKIRLTKVAEINPEYVPCYSFASIGMLKQVLGY